VPPVVADDPAAMPLDADPPAAGALELLELSLLPPQAASPIASARAQAPASSKRRMRLTDAPLTWEGVCPIPSATYYEHGGAAD
jgi:hypothetical protein